VKSLYTWSHMPFAPAMVANDDQEGEMKRVESSIILGMALIGVGVLFLLQNMGVLGAIAGLVWALLFAVGGAAFLMTFATAPARWWALIPGFALLSLGALIIFQELTPALAGTWGGALFLGGIGLGFCAVYLTGRERWWALLPGGVLLTLALVAGLPTGMHGPDLGWVFFLGLALTFGLIGSVPTPHGRMRWAFFPAAILLAMALLGMAFTGEVLGILWPAIMILAGLFLAFHAMRTPQRAQIAVHGAAPQPASTAPTDESSTSASDAVLAHDDPWPLQRAVGEEQALEMAHKDAL